MIMLRSTIVPQLGRRSPIGSSWKRSLFVVPKRDEQVLLGCVSYDPAVGDIWEMMKSYFRSENVPFDFVLYTNYEQQVGALLAGHIDIAWNGPIAHVMCESLADSNNDKLVSLGMRDVDQDFESIIVANSRKNENVSSLDVFNGSKLLTGTRDSPQGSLIGRYWLDQVKKVKVSEFQAFDVDMGKHGDTAIGEIKVMEQLASGETDAAGAILSRMMWDRGVAGKLPTVNKDKLTKNAAVLQGADNAIPKFDHCQFDCLESNPGWKRDQFSNALFKMDMANPNHTQVMKLEGIQKEWKPPRKEGYRIIRDAMNWQFQQRRSMSTTKSPRVGVIGCGVAGLQVIRSMKGKGIPVDAYDASPDVGGVWRENYQSFGLQVPQQLYEFPDFPMNASEGQWGKVPTGEQVQSYIKRFTKEKKLDDSIHLNTIVEKVEDKPDGTWEFHVKNLVTQETSKVPYDYCVVSSGMYGTPFQPEIPGKFNGVVKHSSEFIDGNIVKGKKVLVVGGAKSAIDCAIAASDCGAAQVTMLQRKPHWPTPLNILGLIPFQLIFLSRFGQALVSAHRGALPGTPNKSKFDMFNPIVKPVFSIVEALIAAQFGLKGEFRPSADVVSDLYGYAHILDGTFHNKVKSGQISLKQGEIKEYAGDHVTLKQQGKEDIPCDIVIFATGFKKDYSVFSESVQRNLGLESDGLYLYRYMLPPAVPNLAFIGSEVASIFNITTHGIQAEWLSRNITTPPSKAVMDQAVNETRQWARSWMPETSSRANLVLLHQIQYHDQLLRDMGESTSRKSNPVLENLWTYYPKDYDGIIQQ